MLWSDEKIHEYSKLALQRAIQGNAVSVDEIERLLLAMRDDYEAALAAASEDGGWIPVKDGERITLDRGEDKSAIQVGRGYIVAIYEHKLKPKYSHAVKASHGENYAFCWRTLPAQGEGERDGEIVG